MAEVFTRLAAFPDERKDRVAGPAAVERYRAVTD
jgi:hypothetical protein